MLFDGLRIGQYPSLHAQVELITTLPQTTALGLPHGWELVNQVGVVALFASRSCQWASYFGVPMVLITMSFRAYAQVLPIVKRRGIIPRSEPATEKKNWAEIPPNVQKLDLYCSESLLQHVSGTRTTTLLLPMKSEQKSGCSVRRFSRHNFRGRHRNSEKLLILNPRYLHFQNSK